MPLASVKLKDDDRINVEPTAVAGISAFLGKLWKMVEDPKTDHLISWGKSGNTFVIKNQIDFAKTVLPNYYKHNNIASFIRQLNMYGFHKIISTTSGALDSTDNDEIEFTHPCFVRGHPYLLEQIKRKMNNPKENFIKSENGSQCNESIKRVLNDIKNLKGKQEYLGNQLCAVKQENEILWRELSLLRQKHAAQNNVLNKLIRFLVSLAQPSSNHNLVKRRLVPLMLKDADSSSKSKQSFYEGDHMYTVKKKEETSSGPTIHEIQSSDLPENVQIIETPVMEITMDDSPIMVENEVINSPASSVSNCEIAASPEPVPAALLLPSKKGKSKIQTVYLTPGQQMPSHFLIPQCTVSEQNSPEYLIPERTDNPLLELVHETETDDNNEYITIVTSEGNDIADNSLPVTLISKDSSESMNAKANARKKTAVRKRTRKEVVPAQASLKSLIPKKGDRRKKIAATSKESTENAISSSDFLFDIDLENYSAPLIEIHSPMSSATQQLEHISDVSPQKKNEMPLCVQDMINVPPSTNNTDNLNPTITTETAQINRMLPRNNLTDQSESTKNTENIQNLKDVDKTSVCNVNVQMDQFPDNRLRKCINECIDHAQNMRIACSESSVPPTKAYVDDISMQLDSVQSEIDSIKERIENEGLANMQNDGLMPLDMMNSLIDEIFSQDSLNYEMPIGNSGNFHKLNEEKVEGNELISSAPPIFDFNDIFSQNDWSQPGTPLGSLDTDYNNLNTPQLARNADEAQLVHPPPTKKIKSK